VSNDPLSNLIEAGQNSPLAEADPLSLNELMERVRTIFNKRPLDLTDGDLETTKLFFRSQRAKFAQLAKERENTKLSKPRGPRATSVSEALKRSITEIEL